MLLARASRGREVLAEMLTAAGATVEQVVVYESRDVAAPDDEVAKRLAAGEIDLTTVTSSAIARSLVSMFGESLAQDAAGRDQPAHGRSADRAWISAGDRRGIRTRPTGLTRRHSGRRIVANS